MEITVKRGKREDLIKAWDVITVRSYQWMKTEWRFKHVWPGRFKDVPTTEVDNFCTIAYDGERPIGVFGMSLTKRGNKYRLLGKQIASDPEYRGLGVGQALIIENEKYVKDTYDKADVSEYVITCLDTTSGIFKHKWGLDPIKVGKANHDDISFGDKFLVPLYRDGFDEQYEKVMNKIKEA